MSDAFIEFATLILSESLILLNRTFYPGLNFSVWQIMVYSSFSIVLVSLVRKLYGHNTYGTGGNNKNIKVSKDRAGDSK